MGPAEPIDDSIISAVRTRYPARQAHGYPNVAGQLDILQIQADAPACAALTLMPVKDQLCEGEFSQRRAGNLQLLYFPKDLQIIRPQRPQPFSGLQLETGAA